MSDTVRFNAVAGMLYVVDADDLGSQGAAASIELNGATIMATGSAAPDSASRHANRVMTLDAVNTLVVRLVGKPGSLIRVAVWPLSPPGPTVLGVAVRPASVLLKIGDQAQLTADVQVLGGAPTTVFWSTSKSSVAVVGPTGTVTGVSLAQTQSPYVTIIATSTSDPTKADSAHVAVVDWRMVSPDIATFVSTGASLPVANPLKVQLKSEMCVASFTAGTPFTRVDFYGVSSGSPVLLGSTSSLITILTGSTKCIQWWFTWTPGTAFGVGPQSVYAVGVDAAGATVATTFNTKITTTNP